MEIAKSKMNMEIKSEPKSFTLAEQVTAAISRKNIPRAKLEADENGNAIVDKDKHPEIYNWAVNG